MNTTVNEVALIVGAAMGGGFLTGRFFIGDTPYALITAPKAEGEHEGIVWHPKRKEIAGAASFCDGRANTIAMAEADSPLAQWARALRIGGLDDWHIPSRQEALLQFYNLHVAKVGPFADGGAEAFEDDFYWTSTQFSSGHAWGQYFYDGGQYTWSKDGYYRARAVRTIAL